MAEDSELVERQFQIRKAKGKKDGGKCEIESLRTVGSYETCTM